MIISPANLSFFFTALETRYWTAYDTAPVVYPKISTTYPVGTEQWVSGWIGMLDKAREWVGSRVVHTPAPLTYLVQIQNFELTESIDQFKLEDDTHGIYNPTVEFMGMQMKKVFDYQLRDMLQNTGSQVGARQNGLDGTAFFGTSHNVSFYDSSKGVYINDFTNGGQSVNGNTIGGGLAPNAFASVWQYMSGIPSESGEVWGIEPSVLVHGPRLKLVADTILQAQFMGLPVIGNIGTANFPTAGSPSAANSPLIGTTTNVLGGKSWADQICWLDLGSSVTVGGGTYHDVWYLGDFGKPIKPLSILLRQAPDFTYRVQPDDPLVFDTHTFAYGSKCRFAPAWGFSQMLARSGP